MLNLLIALVLMLIALCPAAPVVVSLPALCGAGVILLTWEAPVPPTRAACAGPCACAGGRGLRGPARGEEANDNPDHAGYQEIAEWVEFNGHSGGRDCAGGPGAL